MMRYRFLSLLFHRKETRISIKLIFREATIYFANLINNITCKFMLCVLNLLLHLYNVSLVFYMYKYILSINFQKGTKTK